MCSSIDTKRPLVALLYCLLLVQTSPAVADKLRIVVLTDYFKDPDDKQSMIRLLSYGNEFEIRGLVATSLAYGTGEVHPEWIKELIDEYGRVRDNLAKHDSGFPTVDALKEVVKAGAPVVREWEGRDEGFETPFGRDPRSSGPMWAHTGPLKDTPASEHIIDVVDESPRSTWIIVWGGSMDLAQALWKVRYNRSAEEASEFVQKIRLYHINWQDTGAVWLWNEFPNLFRLQSNELHRGMYEEGAVEFRDQNWVDTNVRHDHGALGAQYPEADSTEGVKEGDSPSFLYLIPNGLSDPEHPDHGGWGGRFKAWGHGTRFYVDAEDRHPTVAGEETAGKRWTVGRWNEQRNLDFANRMDWAVKDYANGNHNPVAVLNGDESKEVLSRAVVSGSTIELDAGGSRDPDGDRLSYSWWQYQEPGSYEGSVSIRSNNAERASLVAPTVDAARTIHVILEVTDNGDPRLTSYRRLIVTVNPADS